MVGNVKNGMIICSEVYIKLDQTTVGQTLEKQITRSRQNLQGQNLRLDILTLTFDVHVYIWFAFFFSKFDQNPSKDVQLMQVQYYNGLIDRVIPIYKIQDLVDGCVKWHALLFNFYKTTHSNDRDNKTGKKAFCNSVSFVWFWLTRN